jgi:hypothetical protein
MSVGQSDPDITYQVMFAICDTLVGSASENIARLEQFSLEGAVIRIGHVI